MAILNDQEVFRHINCRDCKAYHYTPSRLYPADNAYPEEHECRNGDFGNDKPCDEILAAVEMLIENDALSSGKGYMASADICKDVEKEVFFDVSWEDHPYWWVWYDERDPEHYDSLKEVWNRLFL